MAINKAKLHHRWRQLKNVKVWYLLLALVVFGVASVLFLRQNNLEMIERRRAVIQADEQQGDITGALKELQMYMAHHMNTRMSEPVQLAHTYDRISQERINAAAESGRVADADAYRRAAEECGAPSTITYAQCVIDYTTSIPEGSDPITEAELPDPSMFSYNFYTPYWSPDLAGFSLLLFFLTLLVLFCRITGERIARAILRHKQQ